MERALFIRKPPKPKPLMVWSVEKLLAAMKRWGPVETLPIQRLTFRTAAILALASCKRPADLTLLSIDKDWMLDKGEDTIMFQPKFGANNRRKKHPFTPPLLLRSSTIPELCPVRHVRRYIAVTTIEESQPRCGNLFIRLTHGPGIACSPPTMSRWLKQILILSGQAGNGGSFRSTGTTHALMRGATVGQIMAAGDWASTSVASQHYLRQVSGEAADHLHDAVNSIQAINLHEPRL
jgi:hypothetical protein